MKPTGVAAHVVGTGKFGRESHRRGLRLGNRAGPSTPKGLFRKSSRLREFSGGVARRATNDDEDDRPSWSASSDAEKNAASSNPKPKKQKPITPMTGMGTRYLDVEEISDASLAIAFVLAVASAVAVGYLVFTAPNKDSPQFQRRDGLDAVKLGVVDEVGEAPNVA